MSKTWSAVSRPTGSIQFGLHLGKQKGDIQFQAIGNKMAPSVKEKMDLTRHRGKVARLSSSSTLLFPFSLAILEP